MKDLIYSEVRRLADTATWSLAGWRACWATEKSLRQWTAANAVSCHSEYGRRESGSKPSGTMVMGAFSTA